MDVGPSRDFELGLQATVLDLPVSFVKVLGLGYGLGILNVCEFSLVSPSWPCAQQRPMFVRVLKTMFFEHRAAVTFPLTSTCAARILRNLGCSLHSKCCSPKITPFAKDL